MNIRKIFLNWTLLGIFMLCIAIPCTVISQQNISSDDLLKLRNLQYEQAKRIVRMQDLKNEFDKLNSEQQQYSIAINEWIKDQAKKQNKDLTKEQFDLDQLKFVEIKKNE